MRPEPPYRLHPSHRKLHSTHHVGADLAIDGVRALFEPAAVRHEIVLHLLRYLGKLVYVPGSVSNRSTVSAVQSASFIASVTHFYDQRMYRAPRFITPADRLAEQSAQFCATSDAGVEIARTARVLAHHNATPASSRVPFP